MDPITSATFLLLILLALSTALLAIAVSIPAVVDTTVQETYCFQLRSILAPQVSITTASGMRTFRMALPLPAPKAARLAASTGLRPAQTPTSSPELLASAQETRVVAPKARGIGGTVQWLAADALTATELPKGVQLTAFQAGLARTFASYVDCDGDVVQLSRLEPAQHVFAVPVVVPYAPSAPTNAGKGSPRASHLSHLDTGQDMGLGMLGSAATPRSKAA
jgi:hypothetical protein